MCFNKGIVRNMFKHAASEKGVAKSRGFVGRVGRVGHVGLWVYYVGL